MRDQTRVDTHRVVGMMSSKGGPAIDNERAHGRAEPRRGQHDGVRERRIVDAGDAGERVADDLELQARLCLGGDVLPAAAATALACVRARWQYSIR